MSMQLEKSYPLNRNQVLRTNNSLMNAYSPDPNSNTKNVSSDLSFEGGSEVIDSSYYGKSIKRMKAVETSFQRVDFSRSGALGSRFSRSCFHDCTFVNANFQHSEFQECCFMGTERNPGFIDSNMGWCSWSKSTFKNFSISGTSMNGSQFDNAVLENLQLRSASFENSSFAESKISNINFAEANVEYCDFTGADPDRVLFGINQILYLQGFDLNWIAAGQVLITDGSLDSANSPLFDVDKAMKEAYDIAELYASKREYFPLANLMVIGENPGKFTTVFREAMTESLMDRRFREAKYLARLASSSGYISKEELSEWFLFAQHVGRKYITEPWQKKLYLTHLGEMRDALMLDSLCPPVSIRLVYELNSGGHDGGVLGLQFLHKLLDAMKKHDGISLSVKSASLASVNPNTVVIHIDNVEKLTMVQESSVANQPKTSKFDRTISVMMLLTTIVSATSLAVNTFGDKDVSATEMPIDDLRPEYQEIAESFSRQARISSMALNDGPQICAYVDSQGAVQIEKT